MRQGLLALQGVASSCRISKGIMPISKRDISQISGILNNVNFGPAKYIPQNKYSAFNVTNPINLYNIVGRVNFMRAAYFSTQANPLNYIALSNILQNVEFNLVFIDPEFGKSFNKYFKKHIDLQLQKTNGKNALTAKYPCEGHETSIHFKVVQEEQEKHMHLGPRVLTAFAAKEWAFYIGDRFENGVPKTGDLSMYKVIMPPGIVTIALKDKTIHGFESKSLSVISVHYTDMQEAKEAGISSGDLANKEMISSLTITPKQSRIKVLNSIAYQDIDYIKRQAVEIKGRN